jgi:hypothetical protein
MPPSRHILGSFGASRTGRSPSRLIQQPLSPWLATCLSFCSGDKIDSADHIHPFSCLQMVPPPYPKHFIRFALPKKVFSVDTALPLFWWISSQLPLNFLSNFERVVHSNPTFPGGCLKMVSQKRTQDVTTGSNAITEESTLEPASTIEGNPRNSDSIHSQLLEQTEQTEQTFEDRALPPPPYEETESRSNMPRDSSAKLRSRRDSHSSETRHLTLGNARCRDVNENVPSSSSSV